MVTKALKYHELPTILGSYCWFQSSKFGPAVHHIETHHLSVHQVSTVQRPPRLPDSADKDAK